MLHYFHRPPQVRFEPVFAFPFAIVASVEPDMMQTRELLCDSIHEQDHPIPIWNIGLVHLGFEHEALRIHEQMALASFDLLPAIIAAGSAHPGGLNGLTVNDARAWLAISTQVTTH